MPDPARPGMRPISVTGIDWATGPSMIGLRCPFNAGASVSLYVTWADVPEWWPCTCGAEHQKPKPASGGIVTDGN
jgi:hypothetical protein